MNLPKEILLQVEKPARYIGNEINEVIKNPDEVDIRYAFCFPDSYEVGMSYLGLQILYYFYNSRDDVYCERCFAPWHDMESKMRENNIRLFALETGDELLKFDFVGFTLQYEMSFSNILNMLDLAGISIWAKDRGEDEPFIVGGGPCAYNPEPLADFFDYFYIGEGEVVQDRIFDIYKEHKKNGGSRKEFLEKLLDVEGVYVPCFYDAEYNEDGTLKSFEPNHPKAKRIIKKVVVKDFDKSFFPEKQLVPLIEVVHDRTTLEVFRGCIRGCRFCQAGFIYRPVREKNYDTLIEQSKSLINASGCDEISLTSLSTGDYTHFRELANGLLDIHSKNSVNLSLPSLRIDAFSLELMQKVQEVRKTSLTFAPEAGTQRLRDVINKGITEEEILDGCALAFEGGWNRVKLYFMVGLPTETDDDLLGIDKLSSAIVEKYFEIPKEERKGRPVSVVVSSSCFVPKPFTPFQWVGQATVEEFFHKQKFVKTHMERKQVKFNYHEPQLCAIEAVLARGDRRLSQAIYKAWEMGAKFDGWTENFKYDTWIKAIEACGLTAEFYANRTRSVDELLPWDHISVGVSKQFFIREYEKALNEAVTPNCRKECSNCGAKCFGGGVCFEEVQN